MSKILIIERHRMLQHAIVFVLCPNYEVKTVMSMPSAADLGDVDAVVVDGASLGNTDGSIAQALRAVQGWNVPTVWVGGGADVQVPRREKLVAIETPIEKRALLAALAECLGSPSSAKAEGSEVIDLVDVIDEGSPVKQD